MSAVFTEFQISFDIGHAVGQIIEFIGFAFIPQDFDNYEAQVLFDRKLADLGCFDFSGFGPSRDELSSALTDRGLAIRGFGLRHATPVAGHNS